jgi:signal transduction histidine kinase
MRLTFRLVLWFFLCVVLAVGINGYYGVRSELRDYETEMARRHVVIGLVLRAAFAEVMTEDGEGRATSMLDYTDKHIREVDVRWVHLRPDASAEHLPHVALAKLGALREDREVNEKADGKLWSYVPVHIEGRDLSALEFSASLDGERAVVRNAIIQEVRAVVLIALAVGIAAGLLGIFLVGRPIRRLVEHARRIGNGDFSPTAALSRRDEISELGREMNAMCTQLSDAQEAKSVALDQVRRVERLSTVGTLASGLAHELGTPLNVITLRAKAISQGRAVGDGAREAATSIAEQTSRMTMLVRQLLDFARRKTPQRDIVDLAQIARRTAHLVDAVASKARVEFEIEVPEQLPKVRGDASQLEQVLANLFMNAIHAMPDGGTVHVSTDLATTTPPVDHGGRPGSYVVLSVRDAGEGISAETLPHIFEPFFTTKDVGEGTGLGLAVCYGIVRDHGGWIDVTTRAGHGSTFSVYLPKDPS